MKTYGQYCGLAKALDHVGDRWTLLIVRELLVGPRRYSRLRSVLPGIATNLLADRLRALESDDVIRRNRDGAYELTEFGRGLEDVVHGLVRWGGRWMQQRGEQEVFEPEWLAVALRALLPGINDARIELHVEGGVVSFEDGEIKLGGIVAPDAVVEAAPDILLGVVIGALPLSELSVTGSRAAVKAALQK